MPKVTLGRLAHQEIISSMQGLKGSQAKAEAARLADHFGVSVSRVYEVTKAVRPARASRADKGRRRADLLEDPALLLATEQIVTKNLDPDLALELAAANGHAVPVKLGTFRRYLRETGLNRRALRSGRRAYRSFEASAPGDIFQVDFSGVKERWVDIKTRRILYVDTLEVSKNHPNTNPTRRPLWKFTLKDDHSRYLFVRFFDCPRPTSVYAIEFLLEGFRHMGIPRMLYADNDSILRSARMNRAASILDRYFVGQGGFRVEQHKAGNPQATGKVEAGHLLVEKFEKLIGCADAEQLTLARLNDFAADFCDRYNWQECRATGEKPALRFRNTTTPLRVPPPAVLDSAFKADERQHRVAGNLVVSYDGVQYQLPRKAPFVDWVGQTVTVVWPPEADYFVVVHEGNEYEIERKVARADEAGEFKAPAESRAQKAVKRVRASAAERRRAHREQGTHTVVPGIHVPLAKSGARPAVMPRQRLETDPLLLAALTPGVVPPSMGGRLITYWDALTLFIEEELLTSSEADKKWLKAVFNGRDEVLDTELRAEVEGHAHRRSVIERRA